MLKTDNKEYYYDYTEETPDEKRRYLVVIIYDIIDNKRRNRMSKFLQGFGVRVQRSAFECILDKKNYKKLVIGTEKIISSDDLLRIYKLTGNMDVKTWGDIGKTEYDDFIIV